MMPVATLVVRLGSTTKPSYSAKQIPVRFRYRLPPALRAARGFPFGSFYVRQLSMGDYVVVVDGFRSLPSFQLEATRWPSCLATNTPPRTILSAESSQP